LNIVVHINVDATTIFWCGSMMNVHRGTHVFAIQVDVFKGVILEFWVHERVITSWRMWGWGNIIVSAVAWLFDFSVFSNLRLNPKVSYCWRNPMFDLLELL